MNIRFEYLYRDAGNFKNWGEVVFANPRDLETHVIVAIAENVLIDRTYFVANRVGVPDLHFPEHNGDLDHDWHEAHSFQPTGEAPTHDEHRSIDEFLASLRSALAAWSGHLPSPLTRLRQDAAIGPDDLVLPTDVSDYVADAVLVFAYNQPRAVLDANVARVIARYLFWVTRARRGPTRSSNPAACRRSPP